MSKKLRKAFLYILFFQIIIVLVTIIQVTFAVQRLGNITNTEIIVSYTTGDNFGGSVLLLKDNNTFFYSRGTDSYPGPKVVGVWKKSNDTLILNSKKGCVYVRDSTDSKWIEYDCIIFKNTKLKIYLDSIVYISGISDIINSMKLKRFK